MFVRETCFAAALFGGWALIKALLRMKQIRESNADRDVCNQFHYQPDPGIKQNIDNLDLIRKLRDMHPDLVILPFRPSSIAKGSSHGSSTEEDKSAYKHSLIRGPTLYGTGRIEYATTLWKNDVLIKVCKLGRSICGHDGIVHGGMIAALFDDFTGMLFFLRAQGRYTGFTANLNVDYRVPMPASSVVVFIVWVECIEGRKIYLKGEARKLDEEADNDDSKACESGLGIQTADMWLGKRSVTYSEARALYVVPRPSYDALKGGSL